MCIPEIEGVRTPSPISMEVPSIVANNKQCLANLLFSSLDLSHDALCTRRFGDLIRIKESTPRMSSLCFIPLGKVLEKTYRGDVPMSPYTTPILWNARGKITDRSTA
ncbi:hypothetical protein CFP56_037535 [Quercus suber]|uniref:Uncharacterized protein n=1 Tax=Quercus suber TaxID=58331 RepID=A0AAW0J4J5_QUESU